MSTTDPHSPPDVRQALEDAVRLAALEATDIRSGARATALAPLVRVAARALDVPVAQINVVTADAQVPVVSSALDDTTPERWTIAVGLDASYCQYVVASGEPLVVEDAREHPQLRENLATTQAGIVAYAGVPLRAPAALGTEHGGRILGSVCVVSFAPRRWTADDVALLEDLSAAVTAELEVRAAAVAEAARGIYTTAREALDRAGVALADSEGRFRTLADSMPQLAWMADETGAVFWYNRRWHEYTGTTLEQARDGGWATVHHPDHAERVRAGYQAAIAALQPWEDTFPVRGRDGRYCWFLSRAVFVRDEAGTVRWFGTGTDVTGRIEAEAEREQLLRAEREARVAAEQANRAKSQFLATMSHELRTPLNAIGGYAELLEMGLRGAVTDAQRTDLARIRRSQRHLLGLINDVLNFARLESGTVQFDAEEVPVSLALQDVATMILPQASAKGLACTVEACAPTLAVRADRDKLRQVLLNLLSNAVKFTPAPGTVRLTCEADAARVRFHVRDTGIGIPADRLAQIFEPFVQVDSHLTRTAGGTGLGLAISRDLARGMGGDITVASEAGVGSVFTVAVPRAPDVPEAALPLVSSVDVDVEAEDTARELLRRDGVHAVLRFLNGRTSHRYTGLYRFDGDLLRNVALFDREAPGTTRGPDAPMRETYCSIVGETRRTFGMEDSRRDPRVAQHPALETVVSYCGALVRAPDGRPLGTLCSFDVEARPVPSHEIPLLEAVAPLLGDAVLADALSDRPRAAGAS